MIIVFMTALMVRFNTFKKRIAEQIIEKEILEKEREKEKQQILSAQNELLEKEVANRTSELKASQNRLIQQEKLASLGELTAGIAHEIQNPLNFVNNFSEVSVELIEELKEEFEKVDFDFQNSKEIINDLVQNLEKITHHGKRASGIVKSMLEHSRMNNGEKQNVDVNALADEYLRLSYHGLRAKDKSFNADFELIAQENLPLYETVPQDLGRVLLNLLNNAFFAVKTRKINKGENSNYKPKVTVKTHLCVNENTKDQNIVIEVHDNGIGIPESVKNKIFQPFFTTKPTGEGTGLGLSLSYDIITKGNNGIMEVESTKGEGSVFKIKLPLIVK
jgi:signal transduction histidine kinase